MHDPCQHDRSHSSGWTRSPSEDDVVEKALERRLRAKLELDPYRLAYRNADEEARSTLGRLELPDGGVVRVGRFRISKTVQPARSVSFETASKTRTRIALVDEE